VRDMDGQNDLLALNHYVPHYHHLLEALS
jgi:hypothetical protein